MTRPARRGWRRALCTTLLALSTQGCAADVASDEPSWPAPEAPLPEMLPPLASLGALYEPEFPLWSNGSLKERRIVLPPGAEPRDPAETAPAASEEDWPAGTTLIKTFAYQGDEGDPERVETRVLRMGPNGWEPSVYLWGEGGARRIDATKPTPVPVTVDGASFTHEVPSRRQCGACHGEPLRLLGYAQPDVRPPPTDETTAEVLGYVVGNCIHCHDGSGRAGRSFDLRPPVFVENTVGRPTASSASGTGTRVVPGRPEQSVLWRALAGGGDGIKPMPPVGVQRVDRHAIELFGRWIRSLPASETR